MKHGSKIVVAVFAALVFLTQPGCEVFESVGDWFGGGGPQLDAGQVQGEIEHVEAVIETTDAQLEDLEARLAEFRVQLQAAIDAGETGIAIDIRDAIDSISGVIERRTEIRETAEESLGRLRVTLASIEESGDNGLGETLQVTGAMAGEVGAGVSAFNPVIGGAIATVGTVIGGIGAAIGRRKTTQMREVVSAIDEGRDENGDVRLSDPSVAKRVRSHMSASTRLAVKKAKLKRNPAT